MDVGEPQRTIEVEPVEEPVPGREAPLPEREPEPARQAAA